MMKYFFQVVVLAFVFSVALWYVMPSEEKNVSYTAPLPYFLTLKQNDQVTLLDFWSPVHHTYGSGFDPSVLTAKSVLMYDLTDDKTIFEKEARTRRPMASLTKIMTAIVSIENPRTDNSYIVRGADLVGEDSMGLSAGEKLTLEELLYGLMLPSGNDAAEVLASNYPAGRTAFIQSMNDKAKAIGLTDTRFSNPSGLQGDGVQYTTAYDLLVMTRYALSYPILRKIVALPAYSMPATSTHPGYELINETNLLTTYEGVKGVKTGYTPEAGLCLVTYIDYGGHEMIGVLLNSENRRVEMKELLDHSLKSLGIEPPAFSG